MLKIGAASVLSRQAAYYGNLVPLLAVVLAAALLSSVAYGGDAIVFDQVTGAYAGVYSDENNIVDETDARRMAMKQCEERGGKRCEVMCASGETKYEAFALGWNSKSHAYASACDAGRTQDEAVRKTMRQCTEDNFSTKTQCQLIYSYHTIGDGRGSASSAR